MADIPAYLDSCVNDGVNAIRSVCQFYDETPGKWESWKVADMGYEDHLRTILGWIKERELTLILCVTPYGTGPALPANLMQSIISLSKEYAPYVIVECENEPTNMDANTAVSSAALAMGIPPQQIQVEFVDSSDYYNLLIGPLQGKCVTCLHFVASREGLDKPWPDGWTTSPSMMRFVNELGLYPSTDGGTDGHNGQFPFPEWQQHPEAHCANADDCYQMAKWNLTEKGRGLEYLGPEMFATPYPNVSLAIPSNDCRKAMRKAFNESGVL
jgi:hypothetical protein